MVYKYENNANILCEKLKRILSEVFELGLLIYLNDSVNAKVNAIDVYITDDNRVVISIAYSKIYSIYDNSTINEKIKYFINSSLINSSFPLFTNEELECVDYEFYQNSKNSDKIDLLYKNKENGLNEKYKSQKAIVALYNNGKKLYPSYALSIDNTTSKYNALDLATEIIDYINRNQSIDDIHSHLSSYRDLPHIKINEYPYKKGCYEAIMNKAEGYVHNNNYKNSLDKKYRINLDVHKKTISTNIFYKVEVENLAAYRRTLKEQNIVKSNDELDGPIKFDNFINIALSYNKDSIVNYFGTVYYKSKVLS